MFATLRTVSRMKKVVKDRKSEVPSQRAISPRTPSVIEPEPETEVVKWPVVWFGGKYTWWSC